ncbi:uncharacterized protein LOC127728580 [Mytilus californianus]|uniref:uncharacterized protein LOC127728580 n=1 Tax=Mytilus californianus TaxID=6549 RepID=UPI002248364A|nr:uncharacterized protein LOC127728580 [Mytilus californianus]
MRLGLNNASDNNWQFGVALQKRPGMIWARQSCIFKCRSCVPTKGPTIPITHKDKNVPNTLILILTDDFCSQNQWLPVSYHITYYPQDDLSLVKNKTTAASPYLRRIELNDVEDNKTYNISWRISSRSLQYGKATNFTVYTGPSDLNVLHHKEVIPVKVPVIAAVSVVLLMILITIVWCVRTHYKEYNPGIDLPLIQPSTH